MQSFEKTTLVVNYSKILHQRFFSKNLRNQFLEQTEMFKFACMFGLGKELKKYLVKLDDILINGHSLKNSKYYVR